MTNSILISDKSNSIAKVLMSQIERLKLIDASCYVFVHANVDGDCIGSACGLVSIINSLGVKAFCVMPETLPEDMSFLGVDELLVFDPKPNTDKDLAIAVDCASGSRMGVAGQIYDSITTKIIIDHHMTVDVTGDNTWVDSSASSASELCYRMALSLSQLLSKTPSELISARAAQCFLTGIVTDTGRFTYSNTNPETLYSAGGLMELGGNISDPCYFLFDMKKKENFLISNEACCNALFYSEGKLAISVVTREMFIKAGAEDDAVSDVVSRLRDVSGVEVSFVLRETKDNNIRVNIRSSSYFDCSTFAQQFGGGGHKRASGFTVEGKDIQVLASEVIEIASKELH